MKRLKQDEGSVYLFGIGLGIVSLLVLTTAINIAALWVTRSKLDSVADGAVLAATNSVNVENLYLNGLEQPIQLDPNLAELKVRNYLAKVGPTSGLAELKIVSLDVGINTVEVRIKARSELPFGYLLIGMDSTVVSGAKGLLKTR